MANNQNSRDLAQETADNIERRADQERRRTAGMRQEKASAVAGRGKRRI